MVQDDFLDESESNMSNYSHWLKAETINPEALNFLGFKACEQHFQTFDWKHHFNFFVDVMGIMGDDGRTSQVLVRHHFEAGRNFDV